jgi:serine/threonine protein kinase
MRMPLDKRPNAEPIRGYRLLDKLGAGGFGEVWRCEAPGGIHKAIKFVFGNLDGIDGDAKHAEEELRAVQHIKSIRHPFLLSIDRVECVQGELLIVTELADHNLHDLWQKHRAEGRPGIPRDELLGYLREAAEVLDLLNLKFDLQHLDIKPHNLFVVSNHVKVADFGLVNRLTSARGNAAEFTTGAATPLYAAPELFQGKLSRQCDQYSLAIVYQELLTGTLPYTGKNLRKLLVQHTQHQPDLKALPQRDRSVLARALAKQPEDRFASCLDLVRALQHGSGDTVPIKSHDTDPDLVTTPPPELEPTTMVVAQVEPPARDRLPTPPAGVFDSYRLLECVGRSPLMETWKLQDAGGTKKHLHIVFGLSSSEKQLKEAVARLRSVHHPALFAPEVAYIDKGRLFLLVDSYKETVRERFRRYQDRKQAGIPRAELIDYLRAAAEVLDYLYQQHGVEHFNLSPRNLVLDNGWLQISEFGYAQILWLPEKQDIARRNTRYAAPELFGTDRRYGADQYSLALIYAEMLTGVHPFAGQSPERYLQAQVSPELGRLADLDRAVIGRALALNPRDRWPSCTDMLLALEGTSPELQQNSPARPDAFIQMLHDTRGHRKASIDTGVTASTLNRVLTGMITTAGGNAPAVVPSPGQDADDPSVLVHSFQAGLPLGSARVKLDEYSHEVGAQVQQQDDRGCVMQLKVRATFWQSWLGREPALEIDVRLARVNPMAATPIEVAARVRAVQCSAQQGRELLETTGPQLVDALQKKLLENAEKRVQDRVLWPHALTVIPLQPGGQRDEPIVCRGKDVSATGVGFYLPHELSSADVLIELPGGPDAAPVTVAATLVRAKRCPDGWYEVGALFCVPAPRRSKAKMRK